MTTADKPVALVTGASSGIGKAAALALVEAGFEVVGTSRNASGVTPQHGVTFLDLDVTSDESVRAVVRQRHRAIRTARRPGQQRGHRCSRAAEESSVAQDQRVFDINFFGLIRMTKAVLPHMRAQGHGRIINISSVLGLVPAPYMASYAATKHAIEGYSESMDHEVREHGVRCSSSSPPTRRPASTRRPCSPTHRCRSMRHSGRSFDGVMARAMEGGDDPATVARAIVAAATDPKPRLRYTAGSTAGRVSTLRRFAPPGHSTGRSGSSIAYPPEDSIHTRGGGRRVALLSRKHAACSCRATSTTPRSNASAAASGVVPTYASACLTGAGRTTWLVAERKA